MVIHGPLIQGSGLVQILTENKFSMIEFFAVVDWITSREPDTDCNYSVCTFYQTSWDCVGQWNQFVTIPSQHFNVGSTLVNVLDQRWNNVKNSTFHNVDTTSVPDIETTLKQRYTTSKPRCTTLVQGCFNIVPTLVKAILNPTGLVMIMDLQID